VGRVASPVKIYARNKTDIGGKVQRIAGTEFQEIMSWVITVAERIDPDLPNGSTNSAQYRPPNK